MALFEIWISENSWNNLDFFSLVDTIECTGSCEYTLTGLSSDTRYWTMVRVVQGDSDELKGAFSTPIELKTSYIPPDGFKVYLSTDNISFSDVSGDVYVQQYYLSNLTENTTYYSKILIKGYSGQGDEIWQESNTIEFTTLESHQPIPVEYISGEFVLAGMFPMSYTFKQNTNANITTVSFKSRTINTKESYIIEGDD